VNNPIFVVSGLPAEELVEHSLSAESSRILSSLTRLMLSNRRRGLPQSAQVAVIADKVVEKTRGKAATLRAAARSHPSDGGKQPVGIQPAFGDDFFNARRFFANISAFLICCGFTRGANRRAEELLHRKQRRAKSRLPLQNASPDIETILR